MGVQSLSAVVWGLYRDFKVFCLMWIPINLSPAEILLLPSVGNKLWRSGIVEGGRSDLSERSIYHRDKMLLVLSADRQEPSAKHIQEMHASEYFH